MYSRIIREQTLGIICQFMIYYHQNTGTFHLITLKEIRFLIAGLTTVFRGTMPYCKMLIQTINQLQKSKTKLKEQQNLFEEGEGKSNSKKHKTFQRLRNKSKMLCKIVRCTYKHLQKFTRINWLNLITQLARARNFFQQIQSLKVMISIQGGS